MRRPGDELVKLLLRCGSICDPTQRALLLERLDISVRSRIRRSDILWVDVEAIVTTCTEHRAVDDLLAAVEHFEGETRAALALNAWRARQTGENAPAMLFSRAGSTLAQLFWVPELPLNFLARLADTRRIIDALFADDARPVGITATRHGLYGMGGIGKSVLAAAVVRSDEIRTRFADGVYWLAVGQRPQLATLQSQLGRKLGIDNTAFDSLADGKQALSSALSNQRALLVLDDVWDAQHAVALEVVGSSGRILITTRNLDMLTWRGAQTHALGIMTDEQARALLARWTGVTVAELPAEAMQVAETCGRLPLALAIAGALVSKPGGSWARVLRLLRSAKLDKLRGQMPAYPYRNVFQAIAASVSQLYTDDINPRAEECYVNLAVFAEDEAIPGAALAVLWGRLDLDEDDTHDLACALASYSLASIDEAGDSWRLQLHDIQRAFVRSCADDIAALHGALVDAFAARCPSGLASGPEGDDDRRYFYARIPYHLVEAGREAELGQLLGSYPWLDSKLRAIGVAELNADFERAGCSPARNRGLALIRDALRLSSHVLARDQRQLASQLVGRLGTFDREFPTIAALLDGARHEPTQPWLCPRAAQLTPPGGPLLHTFEGHDESVWSVAMSDDGTRALSGSPDRTARLWNMVTGELVHTLTGHTDTVNAVALSADGTRALSGSRDCTLRLWDANTGAHLRTFDDHLHGVYAVALSADGSLALSGSNDRTVKLWDASTGALLRTFKGHSTGVWAVALSADGTRALSGSRDRTMRLWDTATGELVRTFERHERAVNSVALSADGTCALSGLGDGRIRLWDTGSGALVRTFKGHKGTVDSIALSADRSRVLSGSRDRSVKLWNATDGALLRTFQGHSGWIRGVALSADGTRALSCADDRSLKLWDTAPRVVRREFEGHANWVWALALSADGTRALSGSKDRTLKFWDTRTCTLLRTFEAQAHWVWAVALSDDGTHALSGTRGRTMKLWNTTTGALVRTFEGHASLVNAVSLSADGNRALSGSTDRTMKLWDATTGALLTNFEGHNDSVNAVFLSRDGARALSGSSDGRVRLWDTRNGTLLRTFSGHSDAVWSVALSRDGTRALSGAVDRAVQLWNTETGALVASFPGHNGAVNAVAFNRDGTRALSGSLDCTVCLWDIATASVLASFSTDTSVLACALPANADGPLAIGDHAGNVHFLDLV